MIEFFKKKKEQKQKIKPKASKIPNQPKPSNIPIQTKTSSTNPISQKIQKKHIPIKPIGVARSEEEKMKIWDQIAGLNPTGQMMYQNGVLKQKGNISQVLTPQQLQTKNLQKTSTNTPVSENIKVEGFENRNPILINQDVMIRRYVYGLVILISVLLFLLNIKKI